MSIDVIPWVTGLISSGFNLLNHKNSHKIELVSARLDTSSCSWKPDDSLTHVYWIDRNNETSPVFDFTFYNHFKKPVVLYTIQLHMKFFEVGLSGHPEPATLVKPIVHYAFAVEHGKEDYIFMLPDPVEILPERSFRFQVELLLNGSESLTERYGLYFTFGFNNNEAVKAPALLLNSDNEEGYFKLELLS